jgi:hypothetical protein
MQNQFSRSWVRHCSTIGLAAVLGSAGLCGLGENALARRKGIPTNPIPALAQLPVEDLQGEVETLEIDPTIPPTRLGTSSIAAFSSRRSRYQATP